MNIWSLLAYQLNSYIKTHINLMIKNDISTHLLDCPSAKDTQNNLFFVIIKKGEIVGYGFLFFYSTQLEIQSLRDRRAAESLQSRTDWGTASN